MHRCLACKPFPAIWPDGRWSCRYRPAAPTASSTSSPFDGGSLMNRARPQSNLLHSDPQIAIRQRWMGVLARAGGQLATYESALKEADYRLTRPPKFGMPLVRGRRGAPATPFTRGEMSVPRCGVRLADGRPTQRV